MVGYGTSATRDRRGRPQGRSWDERKDFIVNEGQKKVPRDRPATVGHVRTFITKEKRSQQAESRIQPTGSLCALG